MTALANEMEVTRLAVRMLEAEPALAEVDLARDAGVDHPLQCAVDGGAADARSSRIRSTRSSALRCPS